MSLLSNITNLFRRGQQPVSRSEPETQSAPASHLRFRVEGEELTPEVESLDEYYSAYAVEYEAEELLKAARSRSEVAAKLEANGKKLSGTVDSEGRTLEVTVEGPQFQVPNYLEGPKNLMVDKTFSDQDSSEPEAIRAQQILATVDAWERSAQGLDNQSSDFNPDSQEVVAVHQPVVPGDQVMPQTFAWTGPHTEEKTPFTGFDIESSQGHLKVNGSFGGGPTYGASLESHRSEERLSAVLSRPEMGLIEKVEWNISEATLHYEKLKKG